MKKSTFIDSPDLIRQLLKLVENKQPLRFLEGFTELMEAYAIGNNTYIFYRYDGDKSELPHLVEKISAEMQLT